MKTSNDADQFTNRVNQLDYAAIATRNRETFLLRHGTDFLAFELLIQELQQIWLRPARERDEEHRSHVGLLLMSSLLVRHCVFGFQQFVSYQSFLGWLAFRPGLEALLIIGKWLDDPGNAKIWKGRVNDPRAYRRTYQGDALSSTSLPKSSKFRAVLARLNDQFVHPNPYFAYREANLRPARGELVVLTTRFFDDDEVLHDAQVLAYLNLLDLIVESCHEMLQRLLKRSEPVRERAANRVSDRERARANLLADGNPLAKKILTELGLWKFANG